MTSPQPTAALAEWACRFDLDNMPTATRERTRDLLIDALACALAADRAEEMPQVERFAGQLGDDAQVTVPGSARLQPLVAAALLGGYRITALTACDVYTPAHFHVTPEIVPPALAIAERDRLDGRALLAAVAVGLEVATRVAAGLDYPAFRARGWHTPGVAGPFGGAAAAGRLLGLDGIAMRHAMGLAGSQAAGTWAAWGTPTVKFHQARASLAGLLSALLAATGFTAADEILVNPDGGILPAYAGGGRPDLVCEGLGERWELERISLRPWPGATPLQPVITALMRFVQSGVLPSENVRRCRVLVSPSVHQQHNRFRHPSGTFEAMLSVDYAAAAVLVFGRLRFDEFMPAAYSDERVRATIAERVEVLPDPSLGPLACHVELELADGRHDRVSVTVPRGHPDDPAGRQLIAGKFLDCATGVLGAQRAAEALDRLEHLEDVSDARALCDLLRPPGEARAADASGAAGGRGPSAGSRS